jgi:RHS repeat-associated protein
MLQPSRQYSAGTQYRYGFNGKENDNEVKGNGNQQDYGMRIYDPRLGRFLSVDPISKKYPELSTYQFASNTPIQAMDLDGCERLDMTKVSYLNRTAVITVTHNTQIVKAGLVPEMHGLKNSRYASRFRNTTLYVQELPKLETLLYL